MEAMSETSYLTAEGLEKLRNELTQLKGAARDDLSRRLREAIQMGDLSENADYIQAKEEQGFLEGRIMELEQLLSNVVIIEDKGRRTGSVDIGSTVTVQESTFPEETYFVVGPKEADPVNGRISYESPIGKALLSHKVGDEVRIETPGGNVKLVIKKIE
jgi:transcription elongation factor GreA